MSFLTRPAFLFAVALLTVVLFMGYTGESVKKQQLRIIEQRLSATPAP